MDETEIPDPEQQAHDVVMFEAGRVYWQTQAALSCKSTVTGWLWWCDEHDTHGNADSEDEAAVMAGAHEDYFNQECMVFLAQVSDGKPVLGDD
jgi:hypothetical protein